MRSYLLTAVAFLTCSSFLNDGYFIYIKPGLNDKATKILFDFNVHRLSGERVFISWHTEGESQQVRYEVLRKHRKKDLFTSLGIVPPKLVEDNSADYSFVDENNFLDSSYYCLKKTNVDSVIFYSITKTVEGVTTER